MKIIPTTNNFSQIEQLLNSFAKKQTQFNSTKELYTYARKRITGVACKLKKEYLIIADTKKNIIINEKIGNNKNVFVENWLIPTDRKNITIMHGHPCKKNAHLSMQDCLHLCQNEYDKIIAFNKEGKYSLLQILPNTNIELAKQFFKYGLNAIKNLKIFDIKTSKKIIKNYDSRKKLNEKCLEQFVTNHNINMRYSSSLNK